VTRASIRQCPDCAALIEKNAGCDSMDCWRCGRKFRWQEAKLLGGAQPGFFGAKPGVAAAPVPAAPGFSFGNAARSAARSAATGSSVGAPAATGSRVGGFGGFGPAAAVPTPAGATPAHGAPVPPLPACPDVGGQPAAVGRWLDALGLGGLRVAFARESVDFAALRRLTDEALRERLRVTSWGQRAKLLKGIRALPPADALSPSPALAAPVPAGGAGSGTAGGILRSATVPVASPFGGGGGTAFQLPEGHQDNRVTTAKSAGTKKKAARRPSRRGSKR
jgi:hypothetical protein